MDDWRQHGKCTNLANNEIDALFFILPGRSANPARKFCEGCPVLIKCRNYAILYDERGIWGGMTDVERDEIAIFVKPVLLQQAQLDGTLEVRPLPGEPQAEYPNFPTGPSDPLTGPTQDPFRPTTFFGNHSNNSLQKAVVG